MSKGQRPAPILDPEITDCLLGLTDPEIGLSIVDLGLVCRAERHEAGIDIDLTLTSRACALGEMLVDETRRLLAGRFGDASHVLVNLVWQPTWTPAMMSERARVLLGHAPVDAA